MKRKAKPVETPIDVPPEEPKPYRQYFGAQCSLSELPGNWRAQFISTGCFPKTKKAALLWLINQVDLFQDELVRTRKALQSELDAEGGL